MKRRFFLGRAAAMAATVPAVASGIKPAEDPPTVKAEAEIRTYWPGYGMATSQEMQATVTPERIHFGGFSTATPIFVDWPAMGYGDNTVPLRWATNAKACDGMVKK